MSGKEEYVSNFSGDDHELRHSEYCELNENYEPHQRILRGLFDAADRLMNIDIDRAHVSFCNDNKEVIMQRRFAYLVAPDNILHKSGYREFLKLTRRNGQEDDTIGYEIVNGWSLRDVRVSNQYEFQQDDQLGIGSATVYDNVIDKGRTLTAYDAHQLQETLDYFRRLAPIDPTYSRVD